VLKKVVYTAQVAEVAELRKQAIATPANTGSNESWWRLALVAFIVVLIAPPLIDRGVRTLA
jgi:hypothetical protein